MNAQTGPRDDDCSLLSHELRTPVTAILEYLRLLEDDNLLNDPETLRQYLAVVRGQAADLARIVSELTTLTDLTAGGARSSNRAEHLPLPDLVTHLAGPNPVRVQVTPDAAAASIDTDRLRVVLQQLLDNAFRFGTPGTVAEVRAEVGGEPPRLTIQVTNQGESVPEEAREIIFQPFQQDGNDRTRRHGSSDFRLVVARQVAEGAGGTLTLEPGAPITFRLELPLREDTVSRQARALREQVARADAQALRAIQEVRSLRAAATAHQAARELAEAQQLRAVADFRVAHRQALQLVDQLDRAYLETITALARAVEARDQYTGGHVERVRRYSLRLADALGLAPEDLRQLEFGAVLHDVGKIGVPDTILGKPGQLEPDEWTVMKRHPEIGRQVLAGISFLVPALDAVACHHERWDGQGYPTGLAGEAIPLTGRIVAVVDAYDAMVTDRPYRKGLPVDVALGEIERGRGTQFDPDLAAAFLTRPPDRLGK